MHALHWHELFIGSHVCIKFVKLPQRCFPSTVIRQLIPDFVVETFKIIHKNSPSYLHLINIQFQNYNFRSQETAVLPPVRTTRYGLKSFRYNAAQIWNELPNHEALYACTALA
jgi:hypothetical protein